MGEELTLEQISNLLTENQDKAVEGFYITGSLLDEKIDQRAAGLDYALSIVDDFNASRSTKLVKTDYFKGRETGGFHHMINMQLMGASKKPVHDITINFFVIDDNAEQAEKDALLGLMKSEKMVFDNPYAKHGVLDARVVDKYPRVSTVGAMVGYLISVGRKDKIKYAEYVGVKFGKLAEKFFG